MTPPPPADREAVKLLTNAEIDALLGNLSGLVDIYGHSMSDTVRRLSAQAKLANVSTPTQTSEAVADAELDDLVRRLTETADELGNRHTTGSRIYEAIEAIAILRTLLANVSAPSETAGAKWCTYCLTDTHNDSECRSTRPADWGKPKQIVLPNGTPAAAAGGEALPEEPKRYTQAGTVIIEYYGGNLVRSHDYNTLRAAAVSLERRAGEMRRERDRLLMGSIPSSVREAGLQEMVRGLREQLPAEMQNCTIVFRECVKGHGRLTATNWMQHECRTCEIEELRTLLEMARDRLHNPFEPDNQSVAYKQIDEYLSRKRT